VSIILFLRHETIFDCRICFQEIIRILAVRRLNSVHIKPITYFNIPLPLITAIGSRSFHTVKLVTKLRSVLLLLLVI
jgi:hypothetical protein